MQIHLALVELKDDKQQVPVGVSFPEYKVTERGEKTLACLGSKLRLFAPDEATLINLNLSQWLARLADYVHISSINSVPADKPISYLTVSRSRPKMDFEKVSARFAAHVSARFGDKAKGDPIMHCQTHKKLVKQLPYIKLKSLSGDQEFSLIIEQRASDAPRVGRFNAYGFGVNQSNPRVNGLPTVPHWT
jgi:CRISPR-associated endonuclease Csy4